MDNNYQEPNFEKFPGNSGEVSSEQLKEAAKWEKTMQDAPEFAGAETQFGTANETNEYYGEAVPDESEAGQEFNAGITDAAALVNYGLNAASMKYGVENIVQKIKGLDVTGSSDPIKDLFTCLGVDNPKERQDLQGEAKAAEPSEAAFRESPNSSTPNKSLAGAFAAIEDMKELIGEVESADPRYEELRQGAKASGKGIFDYAVSSYGTQNLAQLFQVLAAQREKTEDLPSEEAGAPESTEVESNNSSESEPTLNPEIINKA